MNSPEHLLGTGSWDSLTKSLLMRVVAVTAPRATPLFVVGGAIRDRLLGSVEAMGDLDLAVEGSAKALVGALEKSGFQVEYVSSFDTLRLRDSVTCHRVDIASTRQESYASPGALPSTTPAKIERDLLRRDFTLQSMAVEWSSEGPHRFLDPALGQGDLRRRILRIHHSRSFLDDPTRILRGLRYAVRLGLSWAGETRAAAQSAIEKGALATLSARRLHRELELLFLESGWHRIAEQAQLVGFQFDPAFATGGTQSALSLAAVWKRAEAWGRINDLPQTEMQRLGWILWLRSQTSASREALGKQLALSHKARKSLGLPPVGSDVSSCPAELDSVLSKLTDSECIALACLTEAGSGAVARYLSRRRAIILPTESALRARGLEPGPEWGRALQDARARQLSDPFRSS